MTAAEMMAFFEWVASDEFDRWCDEVGLNPHEETNIVIALLRGMYE